MSKEEIRAFTHSVAEAQQSFFRDHIGIVLAVCALAGLAPDVLPYIGDMMPRPARILLGAVLVMAVGPGIAALATVLPFTGVVTNGSITPWDMFRQVFMGTSRFLMMRILVVLLLGALLWPLFQQMPETGSAARELPTVRDVILVSLILTTFPLLNQQEGMLMPGLLARALKQGDPAISPTTLTSENHPASTVPAQVTIARAALVVPAALIGFPAFLFMTGTGAGVAFLAFLLWFVASANAIAVIMTPRR